MDSARYLDSNEVVSIFLLANFGFRRFLNAFPFYSSIMKTKFVITFI